ncbi:MAG: aspartate--tRNA ligase, partial [Lachnospiraceae bacterium]|nr:aspartate--tRNA ligase [Lachnospiraceae bacterium]
MQGRTHHCDQLRLENVGEEVTLVGWFENLRKVSKNLGFLILRDFYGVTQIVAETEEIMQQLSGINYESTIEIVGTVRERSAKNPKIATGDIEVVPTKVTVLGNCQHNELPFQINHSKEADENTRLKYRYLDLRNPEVKSRIVLRSRIVADLRAAMNSHDFMEITTPILTCSSPEGARDYLVPARNHPGKFYALPQAPQQFKQLLMASGFDRYFQIAPCFRDEDARADRSPGEFYQLDMEMAFAGQDDVFAIMEDVLPPIFSRYGIYNQASKPPFKRIPYLEAMETYGSDKPDLRIRLLVQDATAVLSDCGFAPFEGNTVKAIVANDFTGTRKQIDKMCGEVEVISGEKTYWFRLDENGEIVGGIAKFVQDKKDEVIQALGLKNGDFVALSAGDLKRAQKTAGVIRKTLGNTFEGYMDKERY